MLDDLCPLPATVTGAQQFVCSCWAFVAVYGFGLAETVDVPPAMWVTTLVPLAGFFALYLWLGNLAYVYLAPGYVQMLKPMAGPVIFLLSSFRKPHQYSHWRALNISIIFGSVALTSTKDGTGSESVWWGVACVVGSSVANAFYTVGLQILQEKGFEVRFAPLTVFAYVGPFCVGFLALIAATTEWGGGALEACVAKLPWWVLLLDCVCAFGFSLTMMRFIGMLSALNYTIYSLLKDICLVALAFFFFQEQIYGIQVMAWCVTVAAIVVWQHRAARRG